MQTKNDLSLPVYLCEQCTICTRFVIFNCRFLHQLTKKNTAGPHENQQFYTSTQHTIYTIIHYCDVNSFMMMWNGVIKKRKYLSLADVSLTSFVLLCSLLFTGQDHCTISDAYQPPFQRRRQRTARVVLLTTMTSRVDAENVDEHNGQAYDER